MIDCEYREYFYCYKTGEGKDVSFTDMIVIHVQRKEWFICYSDGEEGIRFSTGQDDDLYAKGSKKECSGGYGRMDQSHSSSVSSEIVSIIDVKLLERRL